MAGPLGLNPRRGNAGVSARNSGNQRDPPVREGRTGHVLMGDLEVEGRGPGVRIDTAVYQDYVIPPYYDSLLAKLIVHGKNRQAAADETHHALENFHVEGIDTLIPFLKEVIADPDYRNGAVNTRWLEKKLEEYSASITG